MNNLTITLKKSIVMLFSLALVATIMSVVDIGVSKSGNSSFSSIVEAKAGGLSLDLGDNSVPSFQPGIGKCKSGCTKKKVSSSSIGPPNPRYRSTMYSCLSTSGGICKTTYIPRDAITYTKYCVMTLFVNNTPVATGGGQAVSYLKNIGLGKIWNPWGNAEKMLAHLAGKGGTQIWLNLAAWSGASSWGYAGGGPATIGGYKYDCKWDVTVNEIPLRSKDATCAPKNDGRAFPYSVGYYVTQYNHDIRKVTANNKTYTNQDWRVAAANCVYVAKSTPPPMVKTNAVKCFWNFRFNGAYSQNKASIKSGGTPTATPTITGTKASKPYISGTGTKATLKNCTTKFRTDASIPFTTYAYYRLTGAADSQMFQSYAWNASWAGSMNGTFAKMVAIPKKTHTESVYGTNVCKRGVANTWKVYPGGHSTLPSPVNFSYSDCLRGYEWDCKVVAPKINGVSNNIQVMRDGSLVKTNLGGVIVTGNNYVRDSGSNKTGISDGNRSYMVKVVKNSSPLNTSSSNTNITKQYFTLWKNDKTSKTSWNTWTKNPNLNKNSYLSFYWSSDNAKSWRMTYQGKLNAVQYKVPFQASSTSPPGTKWMYEANVDCGTATSNSVTVLRSVSSEG